MKILQSIFRSPRDREAMRPTFGPRTDYSGIEGNRAILAAVSALPVGAACDDAILDLIARELRTRRLATGTDMGPENPVVSELRARREGLPEWWEANDNLLLVAPDAHLPEIAMGMYFAKPPRHSVVILGANSRVDRLVLVDEGALIMAGNAVAFPEGQLMAGSGATILVGADMQSNFNGTIGAKNGGIVAIGGNGLWSPNVRCLTDDEHSIRDATTDRRTNPFGGRILVEQHVWLASGAYLMGDCHVGHDGVVGTSAMVRNVRLPPHCVSAGQPARPVRRNVVWTHEDRR